MSESDRLAGPRVIGVTGGIASGKSTVVRELARLGAVIFDADEIARRALEPEGPAYASVVEAFGREIVLPEGRIDRAALATRIFADPSQRKRLESLVHPVVLNEIGDELRRFRAHPPNVPPIAAVEIPLLYEVGAERMVDRVVVVYAEQEQQFHRLKDRTSWSDAIVQDAIESQMPLSEKRARADVVIDNTGDPDSTRAQTRAFWDRLTRIGSS